MSEQSEPINQDLKEIIDVTANIVKTLKERLKDGFQALPDIMALFPSLMGISVAVEGNQNAWPWLGSLTEDKTESIIAEIQTVLGDTSELTKKLIRHALLTVANGYMTFTTAKEIAAANAAAAGKSEEAAG